MEEITCIFCNIYNETCVIEENNYKGRQCAQCSLIYISPRPTVSEVIDLYGHDQAYVTAQSHITGSLLKRLYAQHNLRIIKKYTKNGDLLEIGSGGGYFLDEARKEGFRPHGIELNPEQVTFIREQFKLPCQDTPLSSLSFDSQTFDVIYHSDVICHFHDPLNELKTMHEKLNKDGYLVFETGNIGDIKKKYFSLFTRFQFPDHLFFFTEKNIEDILKMSGFKLIAIHNYAITSQLKFLKLIARFKKNNAKKQQPNTQTFPFTSNQAPLFSRIVRWSYYKWLYFLRYVVGKHSVFKKNRPQTLVVVAQKV